MQREKAGLAPASLCSSVAACFLTLWPSLSALVLSLSAPFLSVIALFLLLHQKSDASLTNLTGPNCSVLRIRKMEFHAV